MSIHTRGVYWQATAQTDESIDHIHPRKNLLQRAIKVWLYCMYIYGDYRIQEKLYVCILTFRKILQGVEEGLAIFQFVSQQNSHFLSKREGFCILWVGGALE